MASGRCIIASDLPVIREVLSEANAYLANANDENEWVKCIDDIRFHSDAAAKRAMQAKLDVQKYSWKARANAMLELVK